MTTFFLTFLMSLFIALSLNAHSSNPNSNDSNSSFKIDQIRNRGQLIVGVKTDYPPWGFYNNQGDIVGLEIDLANDIAKRLGVELTLKKVTSSNRIRKLEDGGIDLLIATMGDTTRSNLKPQPSKPRLSQGQVGALRAN